MKNIKPSTVFNLMVNLFLVSSSYAAEINMRSDAWCPYICEDKSNPGIIVEVVKKTFQNHGVTMDYEILNWARSIQDARSGKISGILGAATIDAPDFIFHKTPIIQVKYGLFKLKTNPWTYKGNFKNVTIGVINGYGYDPLVTSLIEKKDPSMIVVSGEDSLTQLIKMVKAKRIDALYESIGVFKNQIQKMTAEDKNLFEFAGAPQQQPQSLFAAFSPKLEKAKTYSNWIDLEIKSMKKTTAYKNLMIKYNLNE